MNSYREKVNSNSDGSCHYYSRTQTRNKVILNGVLNLRCFENITLSVCNLHVITSFGQRHCTKQKFLLFETVLKRMPYRNRMTVITSPNRRCQEPIHPRAGVEGTLQSCIRGGSSPRSNPSPFRKLKKVFLSHALTNGPYYK